MENDKPVEDLLRFNHQLTALEKLERQEQLIFYLNQLLLHDFDKLVQILYRVDVDEKKLKELLHKNKTTDAAVLIANLLIQRQEEKIKARKSFKPRNDIPEEDKW